MSKRTARKASAGLLAVLALLLGCIVGFTGFLFRQQSTYSSDPRPATAGALEIHFLELGNAYAGDCIYIRAGDNDILIDAGSRTSSVPTIAAYLDNYVTDGVLEYVIVTHAHEDHYAGFARLDGSIFDLYECEVVIDFAMTNQEELNDKGNRTMYGCYLSELNDEIAAGATHYTAADCIRDGHALFDLGGVTMQILDSYYYYNTSDTENDYSVCVLFNNGTDNFLFTGDLEADGEKKLVERNDIGQCALYKAGHHGSKTSSSEALLSVIRPEIVCVTCCAGSSEYTSVEANQFPTQQFVDNVAPYTRSVYVTTLCEDYAQKTYSSMNGTIIVTAGGGTVSVSCSASDTVLADTAWFSSARTCPAAWK